MLLNINRQPESNTLDVADEVHQELDKIRQSLPAGIEVKPFYDQSIIVDESIKSVRDAILLGVVLASIILVLFLKDWGTSIVAGLVIPVTILITFVALKALGQSFNLMTLGGLAAAVGLVIDDAIVVVENIVLHRDSGQGRLQAIHSALHEITVPLIGSTVTPIVVLVPLIVVEGVYGTFFRALALTMGVALFTSLALALTWTPNLSQYFIKRGDLSPEHEHVLPEEESLSRLLAAENQSLGNVFRKIVEFHQRWLQRALAKPWWLAGLSVVLIASSYVCYRFSGTDLMPEMDEGGFTLDYWTPVGASLSESDRMILHVEKIIKSVKEVESTSRRTGTELGLVAVTEANRGDILVKLKPPCGILGRLFSGDCRTRDIDAVMEDIREQVAQQEPGVREEFVQVLQDMIGDLSSEPEPIQIKMFSQNPAELETWAPKVAGAIGKIDGVVDVLDGIENTVSGPAVMFQVDPAVAARAGFTAEEVATDAAAIVEGEPAATPVISNDHVYTVRVRFPADKRASLEAIGDTLLTSSNGHTATLGALAKITELPPQGEIRRENLLRDVAVTGRTEGTDLGSAMDAVQKTVTGLHLPPGIRVEYGGAYKQQQKSFGDLVFVLMLAIVLVFIVLLFEFRTFAAPVAILASALLSTSGVFIALDHHPYDVQCVVVHGNDHGGGDCGEERNSAAGCGPENAGDGSFSGRGHAASQPAEAASDCDDGAGDHRRNAAAGVRAGGGIADAAAAGHRGDWRNSDFHGAVADHHAGGALLPEPRGSLVRTRPSKSVPL